MFYTIFWLSQLLFMQNGLGMIKVLTGGSAVIGQIEQEIGIFVHLRISGRREALPQKICYQSATSQTL